MRQCVRRLRQDGWALLVPPSAKASTWRRRLDAVRTFLIRPFVSASRHLRVQEVAQ